MRAIRVSHLAIRKFLKLEEVPDAKPAAGQVLVRRTRRWE